MPDDNTEDIDPTHALVQIVAHNQQARAFGVTRDPCPSCHKFLRRYARYRNDSIAVSAPLQDYVYRKDGTLLLVDREARIPIAQAYTPPPATTALIHQLGSGRISNGMVYYR